MRKTWVQSLGREDLLEKEMATHSSTLAWKIPGQRSLVGYSPWGHKESDTTERLHFLFFLSNPHWTGFVFLNISVTIILYVCFLVIDNKSPLNITIHFTLSVTSMDELICLYISFRLS